MLSREEAMAAVEQTVAGTTAEACVPFDEDWIVRVNYEEEGINFDPFFRVNSENGSVIDFAIMPHLAELTPLFQAEDAARHSDLGKTKLSDIFIDDSDT